MAKSREEKGLELIIAEKVRQLTPYRFAILGSEKKPYLVDLSRSTPQCSCPDHDFRPNVTCKHIHAAVFHKSLTTEIERFLNSRPDVTAQDIMHRGRSLDATPTAQALGVIACAMITEPTDAPRKLKFVLRFEYDRLTPWKVLERDNAEKFKDLSVFVRQPSENFRPATMPLADIIEYIATNNMRAGTHTMISSNPRAYTIPIYAA